MSCLVLPSLLKSKKGFLSRTRDRTGPRFRSLRFLSIGRFFTEERFYIIFLSNTLIVDTLKYCALKLSLLSTELDIASLSLLRSFHNIMHREGTNFIYSVGRFFWYLLSLSLYSVILFTYRFFFTVYAGGWFFSGQTLVCLAVWTLILLLENTTFKLEV